MPPVISSRGGTVTVVVNEAVRLECEATGVPAPSITWLKDGSPVASVSHGIQVTSLHSCLVLCAGSFQRSVVMQNARRRYPQVMLNIAGVRKLCVR